MMTTLLMIVLIAVIFCIGWQIGQRSLRKSIDTELDKLRKDFESVVGNKIHPQTSDKQASTQSNEKSVAVNDEETISILTAAVCAYLGKKARVKSAHLITGKPISLWAQQGRVSVQASHNLIHNR